MRQCYHFRVYLLAHLHPVICIKREWRVRLASQSENRATSTYKHLGASLYTRRSFWKPTKTMASSLFVLLSLALVAIAVSSPVPAESPSVEIIVVEERPGLPLVEAAAGSEGEDHRIAKRSALRGDNPSNDLLADLEGLKYDNGLTGLEGRRIKFLPTWLG